ncbi:uncharacterized protein LOC108915892 isoform X2 [Anoplophora glabripennis]|uniref:uncharacterized protein LOC108915892 isoform X1 n=1 Tax=Anoplophora glabripennis TaxID=217634 RepID=UPI000873E51D|nr:uncharacterized protein LOC108915892 isoform X1 [Anoplophora glabripennis]XP_018577559.1 uncharacterized protein LOC108915892 isoform X2 [Anoplophora glabripennis]
MDQEKTVPFSIVKQKIIKTDEVLRMYVDVSNKLKKAQQACKEMKLQYDQMVTNVSRIRLEHERCSFNIENLKQRNDLIDKENRELREQKSLLEEQYNQQSVQSQLNIKHLQDELQMLREISYAAESCSPKKKRTTFKMLGKKIENNHSSHLKMNEYLHLTEDSLFGKRNQSNSQVETIDYSASYATANETFSEENVLNSNRDNTKNTFNKEDSIKENNSRCTMNIATQTHKFEVERRSVHIQTVETIKTLQAHDKILLENEQLKQRIIENDANIVKLLRTERTKKSCSTQTEEIEIEDEFVENILKEMLVPCVLSPMSPDPNFNSNLVGTVSPTPIDVKNSILPKILVVPPTPIEQSIEVDFAVDKEQESDKNAKLITDRNNLGKSGTNKEHGGNSRYSKRYKYRSPTISNDFINFVKLKRKCLRRLSKKRYILNKEIRKIRKLQRQDNLLKILHTLKQLNINFTISNDSITSELYSTKKKEDFSYSKSDHIERDIPPAIQKSETYSTEQLNCICKKCVQSSMLLSNVGGETHLLGFCTIKNEFHTPASSRMENNWNSKSYDPVKQVNSSLSYSNNTPENVLETLAEMVSRKLNKKGKSILNAKGISDKYDTFDSETETEIERLFNTSDNDVLKRNKMLLASAKRQNQIPDLSIQSKLEEIGDISVDSDLTLRNEQFDDFDEYVKLVPKNKRLEYSTPPKNFSLISDNVCSENEEIFDYELPLCPQLLSPIKSLKNVKINKTKDVSNSYEIEDTDSFMCNSAYQKYQNSDETNGMLQSNVQNESSNSNSLKSPEDDGEWRISNNEENSKHSNTSSNREQQQNCVTNTIKITSDHNSIGTRCVPEEERANPLLEYDPNKCLIDTDLHEQNFSIPDIKKTDHSQYHHETFSQFSEEADIAENSNSILLADNLIQSLHPPPVEHIKTYEIGIALLKDRNVVITNEMDESPKSPIANDINIGVTPPILIPLEREGTKNNCKKENKDIDTFSPSAVTTPNHDVIPSPQKSIRRSKRISQKKERLNNSNNVTDLNKTLTEESSNPRPLIFGNVAKEQLLEESSKDVCQNNKNLVNMQAENVNVAHVNGNKRAPVTSNTRRTMSKLKSKVLKQVRAKRQMLRTSAECNMLNINDGKPTTEGTKFAAPVNKNVNKICIVQNILIPANSSSPVDLLKESKQENVAPVVENCDIRLNNEQNSSQSDAVVSNCSNKKKNSTNTCNVPNKKRRVDRTKTGCDLLSMIMEEMDKDKPEIIPKRKKQFVVSKEIVPDSTDEKQWRKGVLVIAENIHNVSSKPVEPRERVVNKDKVFNPKSKLTAKRRILLSRLLKLSNEEVIPEEIILEFQRQDVDNIVEIILQQVSQDIWDKPDVKYYPAPLMTRTQRILLGLMVRLEQENMEKVMDTFVSKTEAFLFKVGCGIRTLIPVVRLYMAVCKLRRDIDKMRNFCCDAFLFMGDLAVPLLFTVLTSWTEVLPMESDINKYPLAKILIQVVHLKSCNKPGYNLLPLKFLFSQFYGYPKERWNCDDMFEELFQQYLRNPNKSSDLAIRLLCKNKDTKWVYKKVNEFFKPLIYKIPSENVNFKATSIILIGNICRHFKPENEFDESSLNDLRRWLTGLTEGENVHDLIIRSVDLSLSKLTRKKTKRKKPPKINNKKPVKKPKKKAKKCKKVAAVK